MIDKEDLAQLALASALHKKLGELLDTRGAGRHHAPNLRTEANDSLRELYETTGADRINLEVNGSKVGTFSLSFTKPVDGVEPQIQDSVRLVEWLRTSDGGLDALRRLVYGEPAMVLKAATADGELPDGCAMVHRSEPARIKGQTLRVDAEAVARAYDTAFPSAVYGLLGVPALEVSDGQE